MGKVNGTTAARTSLTADNDPPQEAAKRQTKTPVPLKRLWLKFRESQRYLSAPFKPAPPGKELHNRLPRPLGDALFHTEKQVQRAADAMDAALFSSSRRNRALAKLLPEEIRRNVRPAEVAAFIAAVQDGTLAHKPAWKDLVAVCESSRNVDLKSYLGGALEIFELTARVQKSHERSIGRYFLPPALQGAFKGQSVQDAQQYLADMGSSAYRTAPAIRTEEVKGAMDYFSGARDAARALRLLPG